MSNLAVVYGPLSLRNRGGETEGFLDYQGSAGIISIVRWNLRPVIFDVEAGGSGHFEFGKGQECSQLLSQRATLAPNKGQPTL